MTIDGTTGVATLGNTTIGASSIAVGNATVNTTITQGVVSVGICTVNTTTVIVGSNCFVNSTSLRIGMVDGSFSVGFAGSTKGVRIWANTTSSQVEGVDNTFSASYQPLLMGGSTTTLHVNGTSKLFATSTGVGVGTSPSDTFHVAGNIVASGDVTTSFSDERLKDHVFDLTDVLAKLKTIKGFAYVPSATALKYDPDISADIKFGVSAQKVQAVFPELVSRAPFDRTPEGTSKTGENYLTVDYVRLVPVLLEAINELSDKYNQLQSQLDELKSRG